MRTLEASFPRWMSPVLRERWRYKVAKGGRGGSKSWGFARALLILGAQSAKRILCTRELQSSIQDSVHALLADQIQQMGIQGYRVLKHEITHINGTKFIFEGLRYNATRIKSLEGIDICWVEEAERISNESWDILIPTIRKDDSEIWIGFNPHLEDDPVYQRFVVNTPPNCKLIEVNWRDNPWFPDVLRAEMEWLFKVDPEAAMHVWEGHTIKATASAVLRGKWRVEAFDPDPKLDKSWLGPYHGGDFGFSEDPTTAVRVWIRKRKLYIERESYRLKLENNFIKREWEKDVPGIGSYITRSDPARPETISYLKKHGLPRIIGAQKWPGSIEDGIAYLRAMEEIIIHPRCVHAIQEARLYSHKIDKLSGDILRDIVDKHNHIWDAVRYALAPMIRMARTNRAGFSGQSYPTR